MSIQLTTLPGELRVATDCIPHVETAVIGVWVNIGTRHEQPNINGIAHMLEHMAFKGTKTRSARQIVETIESVGGYLNAATSREVTCYYARVLKEDVPLAIELLADILQNPTFVEEELLHERKVVLQEIGQVQDTPDDLIFDFFQETAYPHQAMGRPILGRPEIIKSLNRSTLKTFMDHHYVRSRMVIAAAGHIDHDEIVKLTQKHFQGLAVESSFPIEAALYKGGEFYQTRDLEQVHMMFGVQGIPIYHRDYYALSVLATLLGGGASSRLFQEIREKRGLAYSIYAFKTSYSDSGIFGIYAGTSQEDVSELISVLGQEITRLPATLTLEELKRAQSQLKASLMMGLESISNRCEQLAQHILFYGRSISPVEIIDRIEAVNIEALKYLAQDIFMKKPTFVALGPATQFPPLEIAL